MNDARDRIAGSDDQRSPESAATPATAPPRGDAPGVQRGAPRWAVIGIFLLLGVGGIAYAKEFLLPVVLSFLLALVFTPIRRFLERGGIHPVVSAPIIVGVVVAFLVAGVATFSEPVEGWIDNAPDIGRRVERKIRSLAGSAREVQEASEQVEQITSGGDEADKPEVVVSEPGAMQSLASMAPAVLGQATLTLVLLLLLLASGDMIYEKIVRVMPTFAEKRRAMRIARDIETRISHYLFTITLVNAGLGVAVGTAMWLLGMPNPMLFGIMAFAFNFVPYVGAVVGVAIALVVALITFDEPGRMLLVGGSYFALTTLEGQLVTPFFVGRSLEMNTVVVFLAIAFWAWLWSVMGMLVAVPLLVTVRVFSEHIPQLYGLNEFLAPRHNRAPALDQDDEKSAMS